MGYFIIIVFSTFLGAPPELLPIAFKKKRDCINYLTTTVIKNIDYMKIEKNGKFEYLTNITNDKFIMCKKIEYPIIKTYSGEISK